jgi:glucose-1-phosphate cytidylyltransferase
MKVIILAGGLGTRLAEETDDKPKPMVLIDDKPILWHLMNIFAQQDMTEFIVALGYRAEVIQNWIDSSRDIPKSWNILGLNTGLDTQTGGRIAQCMNVVPDETVMATYGDGLANVSVKKLLSFHKSHQKLATLTSVRPPARFGHLQSENGLVTHFGEKNQADEGWINGGFFVLEPEVSKLVLHDGEPFESGALPRLVEASQLMAYHHYDFWQPMDTLREKQDLSRLAQEVTPPWLKGIKDS